MKICFLGKDSRSVFLKEMYKNDSILNVTDNIKECDYIMLPIPFTKDKIKVYTTDFFIEDFKKICNGKIVFGGAIPKNICEYFESQNIQYYDLMKLDEVAYLNAIPTAEGAIVKAIENTDITLHGSNVLVLGFGRVAKILADKLKGMNADVFCAARKEKDLAHIKALGYNVVNIINMEEELKNVDIIFSTVPTLILGDKELNLMKKDTVIIDLASSPGSVDFKVAEELGIKAFLELAIPTKVAPKSAALYLKKSIDSIIK